MSITKNRAVMTTAERHYADCISFAGMVLARDLLVAEKAPNPKQASRAAKTKARKTGLLNSDAEATDEELADIIQNAMGKLDDPEFRRRYTR